MAAWTLVSLHVAADRTSPTTRLCKFVTAAVEAFHAGSVRQAAAARSCDLWSAQTRRLSIKRSLRALAFVQPVFKPPDTAASTKRGDSVCCLNMYHGTSYLHWGCLVSTLTVGTAAASLATITATAPDRDRRFGTVPRLRDRLAVMLVTPCSKG